MSDFARIAEFDVLRLGYGGARVTVYEAGTTRLAALFRDPLLTIPAANPQTLLSEIQADGQRYGRWAEPVYVGVPYELDIDNRLRTGVEPLPLTTLVGRDASRALVTAEGSTRARELRARAADVVHASDFGVLGSSAEENTNTLTAAIGRAGGLGGGRVLVPAGSFVVTSINLPQGVVLEGQAMGATVLRGGAAENTVTLGGNRAGLRNLTLDGGTLASGSVGLYAVGRQDVILEDVLIRRFATGLRIRGGDRFFWTRFFVSNCNVGVEGLGDADASASGQGGDLRGIQWRGGRVDLCLTTGVLLSFEDRLVASALFDGVNFDTNTGDALRLSGARSVEIRNSRFVNNITHLRIQDDNDVSRVADNTTRNVLAEMVLFEDGQIAFDGACDDVRFVQCDFQNVDFDLDIPAEPIVLTDCREDADTTAAGAADRLQRRTTRDRGQLPGVTTDGAATTAWSYALEPGEVVQVRARVVGRQRNGNNYLAHEIKGIARRGPAVITFDLASTTLPFGGIISGDTSGASARVTGGSQSGAGGTLDLRDIQGEFRVAERLTLSTGQTARCIAVPTAPNAEIPTIASPSGPAVADVAPVVATDGAWDVTIVASGPSVQVRVQGAASQIVEWVVDVDVQRP